MRPETISIADLRARLAALERAGVVLRAMTIDERIAALDGVAAAWRAPGSPWRRDALAALTRTTGYAPATIHHALDHLWRALDGRELAAIAARELAPYAGEPERLALHSLAGNVPGVGVFGIIAALVAAVPSLVKTARREPELPTLFARSLAAQDRRLGDAVAVTHWTGGSEAHEEIALAASSVVLAYGRADTLDRLQTRSPARLLRFGPRLSIALVARESAHAGTAALAARQLALFDQQGCLSPQYLLLEERDADATAVFLDALAASLRRLAADLPRAALTLDEAAHAWQFVERERWREQEGAPVRVLAGADLAFSIVCDRSGAPATSPLNRHLIVIPVPSLADASPVVARFDGMVEAVGVEAPPARLAEAAAVAAACGAHRLCPLDRMQAPPFAWRQSGHARLASFVKPAVRAVAAAGTEAPAPRAGRALDDDGAPSGADGAPSVAPLHPTSRVVAASCS